MQFNDVRFKSADRLRLESLKLSVKIKSILITPNLILFKNCWRLLLFSQKLAFHTKKLSISEAIS